MRVLQAQRIDYDERTNRIEMHGAAGPTSPEAPEEELLHLEDEAVVVEYGLIGWYPYTHVLSIDVAGGSVYYLAQVKE